MYDTQTKEEVKSRFDLLAYAQQHTELRKVAAGEWAGPCPRCGGSDRFHVRADVWFCRQCKYNDAHPWQDAITLVQMIENCTFNDALARMAGNAITTPPERRRPVATAKKEQPSAWKSPQWQREARRALEAAQSRLYDTDDPTGEPGRAYLADRGIRYDMWVAFGLGIADAWNNKAGRPMPAIWIPWQNREITYITARFIGVQKDDKGADRFGPAFGRKLQPSDDARYNGQRFLFGLQHCTDADPGRLHTLFLVEGELNAVAVFQCTFGQYPCDVLSFGPRSQLLNADVTGLAAKVAQRYRRVLVWADEPGDALKAAGTIPNAIPVRSPTINGRECDANALLADGLLADVIACLLSEG